MSDFEIIDDVLVNGIFLDGVLGRYMGNAVEVVIPNSVKHIAEYAFFCPTSLTRIDIPNSVMSIGYRAFFNCNSLKEVVIPKGCNIGREAFAGCYALETIVISGSDIERLRAQLILPKPLNQYKIIIKERVAAVERAISKAAQYKQRACEIYDRALRVGIRPVVRLIVPAGDYLIDKLPSDIRRVLHDVESVFRSEEFLNSKHYLARELQERILRSLVAISIPGKSVCQVIDFQAQSDDGADLKGEMSDHYTICS